MKRLASILLLLVSLTVIVNLPTSTVVAKDYLPEIEIELLENGYYYETIIEEVDTPQVISTKATEQTITRKKTTQLKNNSGDVLWSVSITATFTYDGATSKCISCTPSAESKNSAWTIKSVTSSKNGNSATATAVAKYTDPFGRTYESSKSVTLTCTAYGVVS